MVAASFCVPSLLYLFPLQWRHNERDRVSDHQPHDCLLNRLFRRRSTKTSKLRVTGLCAGNPVNSPHKWPVTRKMFPFDDVIMPWLCLGNYLNNLSAVFIMFLPLFPLSLSLYNIHIWALINMNMPLIHPYIYIKYLNITSQCLGFSLWYAL